MELDPAAELTAAQHYEAQGVFCFAIGCLTRYYDKQLVDASQLEMEGIDYSAEYIKSLVERPGVDSNPGAVNKTEATLIVLYLLGLQKQLAEPIPTPEEPASTPAE